MSNNVYLRKYLLKSLCAIMFFIILLCLVNKVEYNKYKYNTNQKIYGTTPPKNLQTKSNDRSFALLTFYSLSKFTVYLISLNNNLKCNFTFCFKSLLIL